MHFPGLGLLMGIFILLLVGSIMIILFGLLILFLPAALFAFLVWLVTGSVLLAGLAFFIIGLLTLMRRLV